MGVREDLRHVAVAVRGRGTYSQAIVFARGAQDKRLRFARRLPPLALGVNTPWGHSHTTYLGCGSKPTVNS